MTCVKEYVGHFGYNWGLSQKNSFRPFIQTDFQIQHIFLGNKVLCLNENIPILFDGRKLN